MTDGLRVASFAGALLIAAGLVAATLGPSRSDYGLAPQPLTHPGLASEHCEPRLDDGDAFNHRCGFLHITTVEPAATFDVWVEVLSGQGRERRPPLLIIPGGPGPSASESVQRVIEVPGYLAGRDVVFIDPPGTGRSDGRLECARYEPADFGVCRRSTSTLEVPIAMLSSDGSVAAFKAVAVELGIDEWDVWGASYGAEAATRLATTDRERVRSVVLSVPVSPWVAEPLADPAALREAVEHFFAGCEAVPSCANGSADLVDRWRAELDRRVSTDPATPSLIDAYLAASVTFGLIEEDPRQLRELLAIVEADDLDRFDELIGRDSGELVEPAELTTQQVAELRRASHADLYAEAVMCHDGVAQSPAPGAAEVAALWPYGAVGWQHDHWQGICRDLGIDESRSITDAAPTVPVLILAGALDPRIAQTDVVDLAARLPQSQLVIFEWHGHFEAQSRSCPRALILMFLSDPGIVDTSCAEDETFDAVWGS